MEIPLQLKPQGLYCPLGDFFIDAWAPVPCCVITHAHADHAHAGHGQYIGTEHTIKILKHRLDANLPAQSLKYQQKIKLKDVWVSLHAAGHILGSAQVRIETKKTVIVISGDYKRAVDATCQPFEIVECDIFVTESTFGLPIYQWPHPHQVQQQILMWWHENASKGHPSILFCYALGKAQRIMSLLKAQEDDTVYLHGAMLALTHIYSELGMPLAKFAAVSDIAKGTSFSQALILAPPSALGSPWMKRFPSARTAFASGWMAVRGARRRKAVDRGFVLSDHADWKDLIDTIHHTKARIVLTTHGNAATLAHYLRESQNIEASLLKGLEMNPEDEDECKSL